MFTIIVGPQFLIYNAIDPLLLHFLGTWKAHSIMLTRAKKDKQMTISEGIAHTGLFKRFQMMLLILLILSSILTGIMTSQFQSLSVMQMVECLSRDCESVLSSSFAYQKQSSEKICRMKENEWKFSGSRLNWLTDFRLMCGNHYLIRLETSVYFTGFFASAFVFGYLCDRYGRRLISIFCSVCYIVLLLALKYAVQLDSIFLLRFIAGGLHSGIFICLFVSLAEFNTQKNLWICCIIGSIAFSMGKSIMTFVAYDHVQWQGTFDVPIFIAVTAWGLCYVVLPETPFWFYANGKELQALVSLNEVATMNRSSLLKDVSLVLHHRFSEDHYPMATCTVTLKAPFMRLSLLYLAVCWFTSFTSYFLLDININFTKNSNEYFEMIVAGLSDVPFKVVMVFTAQKFGRNKTVSLFFTFFAIMMALGCIPNYILDSVLSQRAVSAEAVVVTIGKGCAGSLIPLLTVYTCELLPTLSRGTGLSLCLMAASFSSILLPFISTLDSIWWMSHRMFIVLLAVCSAVAVQWVPDTWNNQLPNNLTECELLFSRGRNYKPNNDLEMETLLTYSSEED